MNDQAVFANISRIGKRLFQEHLVSGNFGNMSLRKGDGYFITRTGSYLDADPAQTVLMPLNGRVTPGGKRHPVSGGGYTRQFTAQQSSMQRSSTPILRMRSHRLSLPSPRSPLSTAKERCLPQKLRSSTANRAHRSLRTRSPQDSRRANVVIARGHGTFAAGKDLDLAYLFTSLAEHCSKVLYYAGR